MKLTVNFKKNISKDMKTEHLIIVGGGTSAWMTAAYIHHNHPAIKVTVVDKEVGNSIGVGEATLLSFIPFMEECGFEKDDWFTKISSGYKSGILFTNWKEPGNDIWHPFWKGNRRIDELFHLWDVWSLVQDLDFKTYATGSYGSSVLHNTVDFNNIDSYAVHVDCGKLVLYIQEKLKNKIDIIKSDVINVVKEDDDNVIALDLKDGRRIQGDLYVDCTGFHSILRKSKKRIDLEGRLFVNTAVVCQVPYQDRPNEFKPYAVCDAVDHGWIWKIGVHNRIGSGMVFNRNITDPEEAKEYFVKYWNHRIKKENVRAINWDPFYNQDPWVGNIVQIGLSAGFIEPLESTGIGLITMGATQLSNALFEQWYSKNDVKNFNQQVVTVFEDCVDFVNAHYADNKRDSKFWNYVRETFVPSDRMLHYLERLSNPYIKVPVDGKFNYMFGGTSWTLLLQQLGYEVAARKIPYSKDFARELIVKNYIRHEKHKHVWSRHHSSEIDRVFEESKL
jgi:tryptophan halogenase